MTRITWKRKRKYAKLFIYFNLKICNKIQMFECNTFIAGVLISSLANKMKKCQSYFIIVPHKEKIFIFNLNFNAIILLQSMIIHLNYEMFVKPRKKFNYIFLQIQNNSNNKIKSDILFQFYGNIYIRYE